MQNSKNLFSETFDGKKKFYLNKIEKMSLDTGLSTIDNSSSRRKISALNDNDISVAAIFDFVKKNDVNYEADILDSTDTHKFVDTFLTPNLGVKHYQTSPFIIMTTKIKKPYNPDKHSVCKVFFDTDV